MISLICMHTLANSPQQYDTIAAEKLCKATLIITPQPILQQWKQEILEHAPHLRIYHYTGIKAATKSKDNILDIFAEQDIVLTTYNTIAQEIHYAQEKPDRNLRNRPRREPPKSPLVQMKWWRCLLDEAQMVESGISNAAIVARKIPRINAWAVTGTPIKQSHRDLYGLMLFLEVKPWSQSTHLWDYLVYNHRTLFRQLIATTALRHSKEQVREDLRIPNQHRRLLTVPFTAIEESHYAQLHLDMQQDCGLDSDGAPLEEDWNPDSPTVIEKMRTWLQRLRQTCLHPEIGGRNRRALGKRTGAPLRTVAQVLDVMIEQAESSIHTEKRSLFMSQLDQARVFEHARQSEVALPMFLGILTEADAFASECKIELDKHLAVAKEDEKAIAENVIEEESLEEGMESALTVARQRLRSALEVQHICNFFLGNVYYQLKERKEVDLSNHAQGSTSIALANDSDHEQVKQDISLLEQKEVDAYESAKSIRFQLCSEPRQKATRRLRVLRNKRDGNSFVQLPQLKYAEDEFGGIESQKVFEKLFHYCNAMNAQADQFYTIRKEMVDRLCTVLIDEEENIELTGEEYEDSTKHQDEMYVYMEMMRALFADRSDAVSGQENLLLKQETKQFLRSAKAGEGPAPDLMLKLLAQRDELRVVPTQMGSLRGILNELRSLGSALEWQTSTSTRAKAELAIVNDILRHVQYLHAEQTKAITALEQEVNLFRDAMNARLDFYRALQVISDMVAPIGKEEEVGQAPDEGWLNRLRSAEETATKKFQSASSKKRYLTNLKSEHESEGNARICTICQFEFENGTLTSCGHRYCRDCITLWWKEKRSCPLCKKHLSLSDFHDITYKPIQPDLHEERPSSSSAETHEHLTGNPIYRAVAPSVLAQIRGFDLIGPSYGSKIDTLIRHILYLRKQDPGSKSVVFSQYRDFLDVLSKSLRNNSIVHSKFDDKDGIAEFKTNPASECFLLHAKAHAAGLNLTCANHVILCEPLINTAIELQAIARVHRIGQIRETFVWMYLIEGTVEEAIYDISVRRRLDHMDNKSGRQSRAASPHHGEISVEAANSREMQEADMSKAFVPGKGGGEFVDQSDLWGCLFGDTQARRNNRQSREFLDLPASSEQVGAGSDIARHLRAEAAEQRSLLQ